METQNRDEVARGLNRLEYEWDLGWKEHSTRPGAHRALQLVVELLSGKTPLYAETTPPGSLDAANRYRLVVIADDRIVLVEGDYSTDEWPTGEAFSRAKIRRLQLHKTRLASVVWDEPSSDSAACTLTFDHGTIRLPFSANTNGLAAKRLAELIPSLIEDTLASQ